MKAKLNITIDKRLLEKAKIYALRKQIRLSSFIDTYLKTVIHKPSKKKNILSIVDKLHPDREIVLKSQDKTSIYESQKEKYGFYDIHGCSVLLILL